MKGLRRAVVGALAIGCVALQFGGSLQLSAAALAVWLATMAFAAPAQLRRLWMPRFWLITFAMALGSGLLLGKADLPLGPVRLSSVGLQAGALMIVRGAFLFALMGWASRLIVDDDVQRGIRRLGLAQFGGALSAAFGLIPSLGERVRPALSAGRGGGLSGRLAAVHEAAVGLVLHAVELGRSLERRPALVAAIIGPPGSGKTSLVLRVVERLREQGVQVGGVVQPAVHEARQRVGYRLRDVATGEEVPFARRGERGFDFAEEGWAWARERLFASLGSAECVVIDELGRLESRGQGHLSALSLPERPVALLVAVREDCAGQIAGRLGPFRLKVDAAADAAQVEQFVGRLRSELGSAPAPSQPQPVKEIP